MTQRAVYGMLRMIVQRRGLRELRTDQHERHQGDQQDLAQLRLDTVQHDYFNLVRDATILTHDFGNASLGANCQRLQKLFPAFRYKLKRGTMMNFANKSHPQLTEMPSFVSLDQVDTSGWVRCACTQRPSPRMRSAPSDTQNL